MIAPRPPRNYGLGDDNQMLAAPLSPDTIAALSAYNAAYFNQPQPSGGAPASGGSPSGLAQWITANSTAVYWGVGLLVALAFLSEGRR